MKLLQSAVIALMLFTLSSTASETGIVVAGRDDTGFHILKVDWETEQLHPYIHVPKEQFDLSEDYSFHMQDDGVAGVFDFTQQKDLQVSRNGLEILDTSQNYLYKEPDVKIQFENRSIFPKVTFYKPNGCQETGLSGLFFQHNKGFLIEEKGGIVRLFLKKIGSEELQAIELEGFTDIFPGKNALRSHVTMAFGISLCFCYTNTEVEIIFETRENYFLVHYRNRENDLLIKMIDYNLNPSTFKRANLGNLTGGSHNFMDDYVLAKHWFRNENDFLVCADDLFTNPIKFGVSPFKEIASGKTRLLDGRWIVMGHTRGRDDPYNPNSLDKSIFYVYDPVTKTFGPLPFSFFDDEEIAYGGGDGFYAFYVLERNGKRRVAFFDLTTYERILSEDGKELYDWDQDNISILDFGTGFVIHTQEPINGEFLIWFIDLGIRTSRKLHLLNADEFTQLSNFYFYDSDEKDKKIPFLLSGNGGGRIVRLDPVTGEFDKKIEITGLQNIKVS